MPEKNSDYTRRNFLTAAAAGLASAGLAGLSPGVALAQEVEKAGKKEPGIITRQLGKSGPRIPIVSMGAMNSNNPEIIEASFELGIRHFDTAANYQYGRNEQMLGRTIEKMGVRDKVIIGTKVHTPAQRRGLSPKESKQKFIKSVEASLKRLRTDYVDLLYVHDVGDVETIRDGAIQEAVSILKDQKKIRFAGAATHSNMADVINEITAGGFYDVVLTAINFTMADDAALLNSIKNAADKGVSIVAMKTLAGGSRWPNPESRRNYSSTTIARAALKWVMRNESICTCIPGYANYEHMNENFAMASDLEYTDEEKSLLSDNSIILGLGFCRQCRECLASCTSGTDIPTLMRTHMYSAQYSNFHHARMTLDEIPARAGLTNCSSCSECTAKCANTVDIDRRIDELKQMYG
ncbi:MAG: aldo/keto reductase [candidate division Zixibacteria bacterium]|nr:aldo/keto reductase [candidate division Zixibacteria bacterium]MBU1470882.1 aldo/keto reductase [candidate division Zixibacteria bacterium]MBU2624260.1 aldo/keto reductase [candidate division Zixibacteria bacterium]